MIDKKIKEIKELFIKINFTHFKSTFHRFNRLGIHPGQVMIIKLIHDHEGILQKELVDETKREKATITKTVQRLERAGYIIRKEHASDRRSSSFYLTAEGMKIYEIIKTNEVKELTQLKTILNEDDLDKIIEILNKIELGLRRDINEKNTKNNK